MPEPDPTAIAVSHLVKSYAGVTAVNDISFTVAKGEILGLLGPNGAGKSTTMRILTGYMPATSGTVSVCGFPVTTQPDEVKRRVGYMPENNPLPEDMRVSEYLYFRGRLKEVSRRKLGPRIDALRPEADPPQDHRPALQGLPPAGRHRRGHPGRAAGHHHGRADHRPRSPPDPGRPRPDRQPARAHDGHHLQPPSCPRSRSPATGSSSSTRAGSWRRGPRPTCGARSSATPTLRARVRRRLRPAAGRAGHLRAGAAGLRGGPARRRRLPPPPPSRRAARMTWARSSCARSWRRTCGSGP